MVPDTSKHWPYHKTLLVFCLKFRLAPICEYLNYYYNITNDYRAIPEKIQARGLGWGGGGMRNTSWKKITKQTEISTYFFNIHENSMSYVYIYIFAFNTFVCVILFYWQEMAFKTIALWNLLYVVVFQCLSKFGMFT